MRKKLELLILDCDGVLIDSEPLACVADALAIQKYSTTGAKPSCEEIMRRFTGKSSQAIAEAMQADYGVKDVQAWMAEKDRMIQELFKKELQPVNGVKQALGFFKSLNLPYCVASNSGINRLKLAFECTGLDPYLEGVWHSAQEVKHGKPAPDLFFHVADIFGVKPENCLVVDDSPSGITGATAAGMTAWGFIGTNRMGQCWEDALFQAGASRLITSFGELQESILALRQKL